MSMNEIARLSSIGVLVVALLILTVCSVTIPNIAEEPEELEIEFESSIEPIDPINQISYTVYNNYTDTHLNTNISKKLFFYMITYQNRSDVMLYNEHLNLSGIFNISKAVKAKYPFCLNSDEIGMMYLDDCIDELGYSDGIFKYMGATSVKGKTVIYDNIISPQDTIFK